MKILMKIIFVMGIICFVKGGEAAASASGSLQSQIDALPEGGTLSLKKGVYEESIILKKPIVLEGRKGVIFKNCSSEPTITVTGKKVTLKKVEVVACSKNSDAPALLIRGKEHRIEDVTIQASGIGMKLEAAEKTIFQSITISGHGKENGVDLWQSDGNTFTNVEIGYVQDGFYMEDSSENQFIDNKIHDSRYGFHVMFSNKITIKRSTSTRNVTGAMIMGTNQSVIKENKLVENNQNVNAQGLLLYNVHHSVIVDNHVADNRVGLYMEGSSGNEIKGNVFSSNFVGAQINDIKKNVIEGNTFIGNVNEMQANRGSGNKIRSNYWDAAMNLDTDGDGWSNLPYRSDPYFLILVKDTPSYQLFFQHPGLVLLQKMLKSPDHLLVKDEQPLMKNQIEMVHKQSPSVAAWVMCLCMIVGSLIMIYFGRKKE